ncbi:MAG TPA: KGG domain-containing protein, partial [Anaeromyxobacteraceae bacterium]|nr:KGG domain-containing protein [Anaeromyxobacteraceae bacterium]
GKRTIYHLKRFAMTRLILAAKGNRTLVTTMSGHLDPTVVDRYVDDNTEAQRLLLRNLGCDLDRTAPALPAPSADEREAEVVAIDTRPLGEAILPGTKLVAAPTKVRRGFAAMSPEKRAEIARKGAAKLAALGKAHRFSSDEARSAASKGGRGRRRGASLSRHDGSGTPSACGSTPASDTTRNHKG